MNAKKILVIEDDKLTRTVITDILSRAGYAVVSASDAHSARNAFSIITGTR